MPHASVVFADSGHRMRQRYVTQGILLAFGDGARNAFMQRPINMQQVDLTFLRALKV
jgi:hypothetical protein